MKTLLACLLCLGASAGVAAWQQQIIHRASAAIAALSGKILEMRRTIESGQASEAELRARLQELQTRIGAAKEARLAARAQEVALPSPTPEEEGFWPTNRPYFYLPKALLPLVRFRDHELSDEEMTPEMKTSLAAQHLHSATVNIRFFQQDELSPLMASLLGMTPGELADVNSAYADFWREIRGLEAARLQVLNPPERADNERAIVARMPVLTTETQAILDRYNDLLAQILGPPRSKILQSHAEDYFNQEADGLGSLPREFLYKDSNLWVRYAPAGGGPFFRNLTFYLPNYASGQSWTYSHLFGSDGPCRLQ